MARQLSLYSRVLTEFAVYIACIDLYMQTYIRGLSLEFDEYWGIDNPRKMENQYFVLALLQGHESLGRGFTELKRTGLPPLIGGVEPVSLKHDLRVAKFYIYSLRTLVDDWIESGRDGTFEDPLKRHLSEALSSALHHWSFRNGPKLSFKHWSGEPSLYMPAVRAAETECPFQNAWDNAISLFAQLLDSTYRYRIAKCRAKACTYYYTDRVPRGPLKYGTYCPAHRQKASAIRAVYRQRNAMNENRLTIAQGLWGHWPPEYRTDRSQKLWLVSEISERQSKAYPGIKINWVSRHLQQISSG